MLVRVRGAGASAENSQAIVMHLRAFKHHMSSHTHSHSSHATSLIHPPLQLHHFPVTIDCSHSQFLPTWHEVWNLYDIAYDELDAALSTHGPLALVHHVLKFADAHSASSAFREVDVAARMVGSSQRLTLNALSLTGAASNLLSAVWQLSYVSVLAALGAHHVVDGTSNSLPLREIVILFADVTPSLSYFLRQFALHLFRPFVSIDLAVHVVACLVNKEAELSGVCFMPDTDVEWVGDAPAVIQQCPIVRVPIRDYMSGNHLSAVSLQELAAVAKENMVKNFCPCCGPTDGGGCCGQRD
ncbi:Hypothetical protein, putative [Bodo saltans]|uniref:Uncharacterized protein n=1 Tax=Bodo saltans TaxID=75058 RepID=A0A0S4J6P3_BODSA|nr:Hypothetical protein, putative [Bodo saltans]|eukprot:CUG86127.1 Hypothetical protein, putative [Bodo saltans]